MGRIRKILAIITGNERVKRELLNGDTDFAYGYMFGLLEDDGLEEEIEENIQKKIAEALKDDVVARLEDERNYLLKVLTHIHEAAAISGSEEVLKELASDDGEVEEKTGDEGYGYIG